MHALRQYDSCNKGYARPGLARMYGTHCRPHGGCRRWEIRRRRRQRERGWRRRMNPESRVIAQGMNRPETSAKPGLHGLTL